MNASLRLSLAALLFVLAARAAGPDLGPNVLIFDPSMTNIQARVDEIFARQERAQFGSNRFALLFQPGSYHLDVQVGFYTEVAGLGRSPDDVAITGAVRSKARWLGNANATCNFWRSLANLSVTPTVESNVNVWAVSQATAVRRLHVKGDLYLWDGGWSSGGFLADSVVDGVVNSGSQQQWLSRNTAWGRWKGSNWNMVFLGVTHPPEGRWPTPPYTVIDRTPVVREKPYLAVDEAGRWSVMVPGLVRDAVGPSWGAAAAPATSATALPLEAFHIARPGLDSAATLNAALGRGRHLLFTPGTYLLEAPVHVARAGTVVLGLGYATLQPTNGTAALLVDDVAGVKIGGLICEAGPLKSASLVQVGEPGARAPHAEDPVCLWDICCRVGGANAGGADAMMTIYSRDTLAENLWLWRADHGRGVSWTANPCRNGLVVNGDDVTIYGLFVEHTQDYQTLWNGNGGRVYFYQSELPYDPPSAAAWSHDGVTGYASYKVADAVKTHEAWGLGVYCVFYAAPVISENAFETPEALATHLHHLVTIRLSGKPNSGMNHVINGRGPAVVTTRKAVVD